MPFRDSSKSIARREFLKTAGAVGGGLALSSAVPQALAQTDVEAPSVVTKPFAGKKLTIYQQASPIFEGAFELFQSHFEALTGARISFVSIPFADMEQRVALSLVGDAGEMDLTWFPTVTPLIMQGLIEPLEPFIRDPTLTPVDWDLGDYMPGPLAAGRVDGKLYTLSVTANALALYYRTDKLVQAGLVDAAGEALPPDTWDEVMRYGEAMDSRRDKPLLLMFAPDGTQMTLIWLSLWLAMDYDYIWDGDGRCIVDNADGVAVTRLLKRLMKWAPPTVVTWDFPEGHAAFQQGRGALFPQWNNLGGIYNHAEKSRAAGKFSMSVFPRLKIHASASGHWFAAIAANSRNKALAWTCVREYNSKEWQKRFFLDPVVNFNPSRASVYDDPEVMEAFPWLSGIKASNDNGRDRMTQTLEWSKINIVFQEEIGPYVTGETDDAQGVLGRVVARVDEITRASGRLRS